MPALEAGGRSPTSPDVQKVTVGLTVPRTLLMWVV